MGGDGPMGQQNGRLTLTENDQATGEKAVLVGPKGIGGGVEQGRGDNAHFLDDDFDVLEVAIDVGGGAIGAEAVVSKDEGEAGNPIMGLDGHAKPTFTIFEAGQGFVEIAGFGGVIGVKLDVLKNLATIDADGTVAHGTAAEDVERGNVGELAGHHVNAQGSAGFVDKFGVAEADADGRILVEVGDVVGEFVGVPEVVAIEKGDVVAGGAAQTGVAGASRTTVGLLNDLDTGIVELLTDLKAAIGGTVIDNDELEVSIGLV